MLEALKLRTLVIGNSGSGKSSLAEGLGALIHAAIFDLELTHWKDDGYGAKLAGYPWDVCREGLLAHHGTASAMLHKGERRDYRGQHVSTRAENGRKSLQRRT